MEIKNILANNIFLKLIYMNIYIISSPEYMKNNEYKVGIHKGDRKALNRRYSTYLPDSIIIYFKQIDIAAIVEKNVKNILYDNRINKKCNNRKSEWFNVELEKLISVIEEQITKETNNLQDIIQSNRFSFGCAIM